ncbi:hypothetical protein NMG60_11035257 [Bertholletia excelsa]
MSSGARPSIPSSALKMIQNIKEIAGNHSEEEIYAMFLECAMDPDETAQKLLLQDTFHEVRRKRDRRKETMSNKESTEGRWRPGTQGRGSRGGRGNYIPRYILNDTSGGRNSAPAKENGMNQVPDKVVGILPMPTFQDAKRKGTTPATSSAAVMPDEPSVITHGLNPAVNAAQLAAGILSKQSDEIPAGDVSKIAGPALHLQLVNAKESTAGNCQMGDAQEHPITSSSHSSAFGIDTPPGVNVVALDPVFVGTHDSELPSAVGTIKSEVGTQQTPVEQNLPDHSGGKSTAVPEFESSSTHGKIASLALEIEKDQLSESAQAASSTHNASSVRSLPNYTSRSQQVIGLQKAVGPSKEWKPKLTTSNISQVSGMAGSSGIPSKAEANTKPHPVSNGPESDKASAKLQRRLQEMHISDSQHVIIPNHLLVPEAEKINFCFGSFDASFTLSCNVASENDKNSALHSESSESVEEMTELSSSNALATTEGGDNSDHPQSPRNVKESLSSGEGDGSSTPVPEYSEAKEENALPHGGHQHSLIHTSPSYTYGFMPPMVGTQLGQFESLEPQMCDIPRLPSFVVPQPFDPASYYGQFYRSTDNDGHMSPFHSPGVATKHSGNVAVLSHPASQSSPEGGNSLSPSTAGLSQLGSQTGVMQSSIAVTQQPLPAFRQPAGMPIPHYPPSYIPYGHFFSPFYVPHPTIHQFLSNGAFPQQPQAGSMYPAPPGAASKYSLSQYKVGSNTGNSTPVGLTRSYGPYGPSPAGYNPNSTSSAVNSTANEDLNTPQLKESNVYVTGQQSEGSAVWIAATTPGRDITGLQSNTYYNIPPHGQVTFPPTQTGHGTFASVYHPGQAVPATTVHPLLQQSQTVAAAADTLGPTASVYQHSQHAQVNWPNNY